MVKNMELYIPLTLFGGIRMRKLFPKSWRQNLATKLCQERRVRVRVGVRVRVRVMGRVRVWSRVRVRLRIKVRLRKDRPHGLKSWAI